MLKTLAQYGLSNDQSVYLEEYVSLLLHWNRKIQLTATKDPTEFVGRHVADSLELARLLPDSTQSMIDVGSGGGLPGIVLAIMRPDIRFTLIEPTKKKHAFLSTARRTLGLKNLRSLALRDDDLVIQDDFKLFDAAVARAVWGVEEWLARAPSLVRPGGEVYAMEGNHLATLPVNASRYTYDLDDGRSRSIMVVKVLK